MDTQSVTRFDGGALRRLREQRHLSLGDIAEKIGVSRATVGHWETGRNAPGWDVAVQLADALGVSLDQFRR